MQITQRIDIIAAGSFPRSGLWRRANLDVEKALLGADWPHGSGSFRLNPSPGVLPSGEPDRKPNGVLPIKLPILAELGEVGWLTEALPPLQPGQLLKTGDLDALLAVRGRHVAFEWETGNVSSSHRAISKLLDALCRGTISGGILALPDRGMGALLTDRVGNFEELSPYFGFWGRYPVPNGALRIYAVRHDGLDEAVPHIPKLSSGRALG